MLQNDAIKNILLGLIFLALAIPQFRGKAMFSIAVVDNEPEIVAQINRLHGEQQALIKSKLYNDLVRDEILKKTELAVMSFPEYEKLLEAQYAKGKDGEEVEPAAQEVEGN